VVVTESPAEVTDAVREYRAEILGEALRRRRPPRPAPPPHRDAPHLAAVEDEPV
jgi:hypothetical protein